MEISELEKSELENDIKTDINMRYISVRALCKSKDLPYNKILHTFRIGIKNSNVRILNTICDAIDINLIDLAEGNIVRNKTKTIEDLNNEIGSLYNELNEEGKKKATKHLNYLVSQYSKGDVE